MIKRFWNTMWALWGVAFLFSLLSWLCIVATHVPVSRAATPWAILTLPTGFPSIWDLFTPAHAVTHSAVIVILVFQLIQVWLTGGVYASLARVNTGQSASAASFMVDSWRSFPKLLVWTLLWFVLQSIVAMQGGASTPSASWSIAVVMLALRFLFLYAEIAFVAESKATFYLALGRSLNTLMQNAWRSVPVAASLAILTGICMVIVEHSPSRSVLLIVSILFSIAGTWLMHMIASRYLVFSNFSRLAE